MGQPQAKFRRSGDESHDTEHQAYVKGFNSFLDSNHGKSVILHFGNNLQNKNLINDAENN